MSPLRVLPILLVVLLGLPNVHALDQNGSSSPSMIRGASGSSPAQPDIDIMAKEIQWGRQEALRYKTVRGDWPFRAEEGSSNISSDSDSEDEVVEPQQDKETKLRGRSERSRTFTPEDHYWEKLVTIF